MPATPTAPDRRVARIASSSRCRGEIARGLRALSCQSLPPPVVNPTAAALGSVASCTSARAADASLAVIGIPEILAAIEPDTSTASSVRVPDGSTAPNAR